MELRLGELLLKDLLQSPSLRPDFQARV